MSTRANIILVTPDNRIHQYYHHCDGYFSGVGEELRKYLVYSIEMSTLVKDLPVYDILIGEMAGDSQYEDEYKMELEKHNRLHADIEFLYTIKDSVLYGCDAWDMYKKVNTYKELLDFVCVEKNILPLDKCLHDN